MTGRFITTRQIGSAYAAYQKAIDLTLYHAFAELVVQMSQDDKARKSWRRSITEVRCLWFNLQTSIITKKINSKP